jgi:YihY family inner membrane protein
MRTRPLQAVLQVMRAYDRGGGGMLAGALAYYTFFTMVPLLLLFVSLLGVVVEDEGLRKEIIASLVEQVEPIADVASFIIEGLADSGRTGTVVGLIGLLWGASGFYGALQGAMQRMFPGPGSRDFLQTRLRGVVTVVVVLGVLVIGVVLVFVLPLITEWADRLCVELEAGGAIAVEGACSVGLGQLTNYIGVVGSMGVAFLLAVGIYVAIPPDGPSLRQAFWPAVIFGVVVGLFTALFGWIAPLLGRNFLTLGIVGSVFMALLWMNLTFQALVFGAAWARLRRDRARVSAGPPRL